MLNPAETVSITSECSRRDGKLKAAEMRHDTDVVIVGGGMAGCVAAVSLIRAGIGVRIIDRHAEPPAEFRAEQIAGKQVGDFRKLGLLAPMARNGNATRITRNYHRGALLDYTSVEQYGLPYHKMVSAVRSVLPVGCLATARVVEIETSSSKQTVHCANGEKVSARLVILATGLTPHVAKGLGIRWDMKSEAHSLCIGFGVHIEDPAKAAPIPLTYYREAVDDRIDYLALFEMDDNVRANLFCYQTRDSPWVRGFVDRPDDALQRSMPGLRKVVGRMRVIGPVDVRRNDIRVAINVEQAGVVLIGDAFQTPCPAIGTGIDRILSDVETLGRLVPAWLASEGMGANKIAQFYGDAAKRAFDAECLRGALYRRELSTNSGVRWKLHRLRVHLQRRIKHAIQPRALRSAFRPSPSRAAR